MARDQLCCTNFGCRYLCTAKNVYLWSFHYSMRNLLNFFGKIKSFNFVGIYNLFIMVYSNCMFGSIIVSANLSFPVLESHLILFVRAWNYKTNFFNRVLVSTYSTRQRSVNFRTTLRCLKLEKIKALLYINHVK